jgi:hypothetical protein
MNGTLYAISAEIRNLIDATGDGELTPEVLEQLEALEMSLEDKTTAYCVLVREAIADQARYQAEIDRLNAARGTAANADRSLKEPLFKVWLQRGPGSIEVTCLAEDLPTSLQRVKVEPDKSKIKDYLDAHPDDPLPGVVKHEGKESIRIK